MDGILAVVAAAEEARGDLSETGGDWAVVEGINCLRMAVSRPWAVQAKIMCPRPREAVEAAVQWMGGLSTDRGRIMTRKVHAELGLFTTLGLRQVLELPAMVKSVDPEGGGFANRLEIGPARSADEVRAVLCAEDADLAPLVTDTHLAAASHRYLVARRAGTPVGCALIRHVAGTAHISGVVVLPEARGHGVGSAVSAAATAQAAVLQAGPVWLHAEEHVQPLYRRLGYRVMDVHVQLGR